MYQISVFYVQKLLIQYFFNLKSWIANMRYRVNRFTVVSVAIRLVMNVVLKPIFITLPLLFFYTETYFGYNTLYCSFAFQ